MLLPHKIRERFLDVCCSHRPAGERRVSEPCLPTPEAYLICDRSHIACTASPHSTPLHAATLCGGDPSYFLTVDAGVAAAAFPLVEGDVLAGVPLPGGDFDVAAVVRSGDAASAFCRSFFTGDT